MNFESNEQVVSKGSKTKCGKIQININDQFLIEKLIAFLSNSFVGRKIKSISLRTPAGQKRVIFAL